MSSPTEPAEPANDNVAVQLEDIATLLGFLARDDYDRGFTAIPDIRWRQADLVRAVADFLGQPEIGAAFDAYLLRTR